MAHVQDIRERAGVEADRPATDSRRALWLLLGPVLFVLTSVLPPPDGVAPAGMPALGIFLWTAVWWVSEVVPMPVMGLLALALLGLTGVVTTDQAFSYWSHWVVVFLLGAFVIGHALTIHGLTRRFAFRLVAHPIVAGNAWRLAALLLCGAAFLSTLMSNVVVTMVFMAIAEGVLEAVRISRSARYGGALFLGIAWASGVGGIGTPVGCPANLIAIGLAQKLGYSIGFLQWSLIGLPLAAVGMIVMLTIFRFMVGDDLPNLTGSQEYARRELQTMGPLGRGEKVALMALLVALLLWLLPDLARLVLGPTAPLVIWLDSHLNWAVVSILVATSLFFIPIDWRRRQFAMTWSDVVQGIEWGTLALVAGALAVGTVLGDPKIGWGKYFTNHLLAAVPGSQSTMLFVLVIVAAIVVTTNFISNNAVVAAFGALVLAMSSSQQFVPDPLALLVVVGITSSMAFALPSAAPYCAMVFASGRVRMSMMVRYGSILGAAMTLLACAAYPLARFVLR